MSREASSPFSRARPGAAPPAEKRLHARSGSGSSSSDSSSDSAPPARPLPPPRGRAIRAPSPQSTDEDVRIVEPQPRRRAASAPAVPVGTSPASPRADSDDESPEERQVRVHKNTAFYLRYFRKLSTKGGNTLYSCLKVKCGASGQNATFAKKHFKLCMGGNKDAVADWNEVFPKEKLVVGQSQPLISSYPTAAQPTVKPTRSGLEHLLAALVVRHHLPYSIVDYPAFREVIEYAALLGRGTSDNFDLKIPSRRQFVDRVLLGDEGFITSRVNAALKRHERFSRPRGTNLMFDGVRDYNKAQLLNFVARSGSARSVLLIGRVGVHSQTGEFIAAAVGAILDKKIDFEGLDFGGEGISAQLEDGAEPKGITREFSRMLELANTVAFAGSDNAASVQNALQRVSEERCIVIWGDVSHLINLMCAKAAGAFDFIDTVKKISAVFNTKMREEVRAATGKLVPKHCETRFMSIIIIIKVIIDIFEALETLTARKPWRDFVNSADAALKESCREVEVFLRNESSKIRLELSLQILNVFALPLRLFDSSSEFANCFVYSLIDAIPESLKLVLARPQFRRKGINADEGFYNMLADASVDSWTKHRKPVFHAGYVLCPEHIEKLCALMLDDRDEFDLLMSDTLDVIVMMFRRWAPKQACVREKMLEADSDEVLEWRQKVRRDLESMVQRTGEFFGFDFEKESCDTDPCTFWLLRVPGSVSFREYASRIVSLDPSSCDIERVHQVAKQVRSKKKARIKYTSAHLLSFAKVDMLQDEGSSPKGMSWDKLKRVHEVIYNVTDREETWLNDQEAQWARETAAEEKAEEEEAAAAAAEEDNGSGAESDDKGESSASLEARNAAAADEAAAEAAAEEQVRPNVSRSGRVRKEKILHDMVRFDDDV
jgi:hypothetical protein